MSSARKLQRRMAQRPDVMGNLQKALAAVQEIKGLQPDIQAIGQLGQLLEDTKALVETNFAVQREVTLRLCAWLAQKDTGEAFEEVRKMEARIREQVLAENDLEEP